MTAAPHFDTYQLTPAFRSRDIVPYLRAEETAITGFGETRDQLVAVHPVVRPIYPGYYPSLALDPFLQIVSSNAACRTLVGSPVFDVHLIELFYLAPEVWRTSKELSDESHPVLRAVAYFDMYTEPYRDPNHPLHAAYQDTLDRLQERVPGLDLPLLQKEAAKLQITRRYANGTHQLRTAGTIALSYRELGLNRRRGKETRQLEVEAIIPRVGDQAPEAPNRERYNLTLVPTTPDTEAVMVLLALREATRPLSTTPQRAVPWGAGAALAVVEGLSLAGSDPAWAPESSFARVGRPGTGNSEKQATARLRGPALRSAIQAWVGRRYAPGIAVHPQPIDRWRKNIVDIEDYFHYYHEKEMETMSTQPAPPEETRPADMPDESVSASPGAAQEREDPTVPPSATDGTLSAGAVKGGETLPAGLLFDFDRLKAKIGASAKEQAAHVETVFARETAFRRALRENAEQGVPDYSDLLAEGRRSARQRATGSFWRGRAE